MSNDEVSVYTDNHGNPTGLKIYGTLHPIAEVIDAVQKRPMWKMQSEALGTIADLLDIPRWQTDPVRVSDVVDQRNAALDRIADLLCVPGWQVEPSRIADAVEGLHAAVQRVRTIGPFGVPVKEIPYSLLGERILIRGKAYSASEIADMAEHAPKWHARSDALVAIAEKLGIASWKVVPDRVVFAVESLHAAVDCIADLLDVTGWETDPASVASAVENLHTKAERIAGMVEHAPKWRAQSEALGAIAGLLGVEDWESDPSQVAEAVELDRPEAERVRNLEGLKQILDLELPFIKGALKPWHVNDVGDVAQAIKLMRGSYEERIEAARASKEPHHPTLLALVTHARAWQIAQDDAKKVTAFEGISEAYHRHLMSISRRRLDEARVALVDAINAAVKFLEPSEKEAEDTGDAGLLFI